MKYKELKVMTYEELKVKEADYKKELFNLAIQKSIGSLDNPKRKKNIRGYIAQIETLLTERIKESNQK